MGNVSPSIEAQEYNTPLTLDSRVDAKPVSTPYQFVVDGKPKRKFQTLDKIGEGGWGSVFLVEDVTSKQKFALKIMESLIHPEHIREGLVLVREAAKKGAPIAEVYESYYYQSKTEKILYIIMVFSFVS
jgi:serine/threonine protein kinase